MVNFYKKRNHAIVFQQLLQPSWYTCTKFENVNTNLKICVENTNLFDTTKARKKGNMLAEINKTSNDSRRLHHSEQVSKSDLNVKKWNTVELIELERELFYDIVNNYKVKTQNLDLPIHHKTDIQH